MENASLMRKFDQPGKTVYRKEFLETAQSACPVIDRTIREYGDTPLIHYAKKLFKAAPVSFQPKSDFYQVVFDYTKRLLGEKTAKRVLKGTQINPVVMTANHHGVDYFAQSVQGSMLFALAHKHLSPPRSAALVLSCGNIPLDNITYPQGLLVYGLTADSMETAPQKIPVFSNKYRRWAVCASPGLNDQMVKNALNRVQKLVEDQILSNKIGDYLGSLLSNEYMSPEIKEISNYSDQAVVLNHRLWKKQFGQNDGAPELVQLELESVVSQLLIRDLSDIQSLAFKVMFEKKLREEIFKQLDGHRACWKEEKRLSKAESAKKKNRGLVYGTHFFWGLSRDGRRFSLCVKRNESGDEVLSGVNNKGEMVEFPFKPDALGLLVKNGKLIPSLFTSFLTIAFARGINCLGGYYQAEYLPQMQVGLIRALKNTPGFRNAAKIASAAPTDGYLSGMQAVMTELDGNLLVPAGPAETIAAGGLEEEDWEKLTKLSVKEAHIASLMETLPDINSGNGLKPNWKLRLASECCNLLKDKVVVK